jgi:hypothetical protein
VAKAIWMAALLGAGGCHAADLTALETRWLQGMWPVVTFAKGVGLPLDIVVQPQPAPQAVPLALAYVEGRCKLVLSMRGNDEARATLDRIEPELLAATLELMAAHEIGHCWRHVDGAWHRAPTEAAGEAFADTAVEASADAAAERREEGFADLVGLAWSRQHHPADYSRLQTWLAGERSRDRVAGSPHDTLAWVQLAAGGHALGVASPFAAAAALWRAGCTAP